VRGSFCLERFLPDQKVIADSQVNRGRVKLAWVGRGIDHQTPIPDGLFDLTIAIDHGALRSTSSFLTKTVSPTGVAGWGSTTWASPFLAFTSETRSHPQAGWFFFGVPLLIFRIDGIQKNQPFSLEHSGFQSTLHQACVFFYAISFGH
jgi:hypothetical protein